MYNNLKSEQSPEDEKEVMQALKTLRDLLGLTQDQLGILLGVTGNTISRWETGKSQPTLTIPQALRLFLLIEQSGLTKNDLPIDNYTQSVHQCLSR
jgi:transcriptional regulator with XRE-family HTH domain